MRIVVAAEGLATSPIPHSRSDNLCLDFVNSRFSDHRGSGAVYDRLPMPEWWSWLLKRWGLEDCPPPTADEMGELAGVRDLVRKALELEQPLPRSKREMLDAILGRAPMIWVTGLPAGLPRLLPHPSTSGPQYVMASVVVSLAQTLAEQPRRVRRCGNPDCSFLFEDQSRNRSRRWCDTGVCGNLMKVRSFRAARNKETA